VASWVADLDGRVVGLTGLFDRGTSGEVEPVVVTERLRSRGVADAIFPVVEGS
jgi:N-acetylglutamate synthase-like GNAT family acetyltransferase